MKAVSTLLLSVLLGFANVALAATAPPRGASSDDGTLLPNKTIMESNNEGARLLQNQCEICSKKNKKNKPTTLVLEYIPDGKNSQFQDESKASCRERMYPSSTTIEVNGTPYNVVVGQRVVLTTDKKFDANTEFEFGDGTSCTIHTSCSVPLVAGDQIGPFLIISGVNDEGEGCDIGATPPPSPTAPTHPTITPLEKCEICSRDNKIKPTNLVLQYRPRSPQNSQYQGENKASCRANRSYPINTILQADDQHFGSVSEGSLLVLTGKLSASTEFSFGENGSSCTIHTSCSVPLVAGDQIGPFLIISGFNDDGEGCEINHNPTTGSPNSPPTSPPHGGLEPCEICSRDNKIKPTTLILEYQPNGQNSQFQEENKASCRAGAYPTSATITFLGGKNGGQQSFGSLQAGSRFTIEGPFDANSEFTFNGGDECSIHTSCSVPLVVGDQIGPFLVVGGFNEEGEGCSGSTGPTLPPSPTPPTVPPAEECEICSRDYKNKPLSLILEYSPQGKNSKYQNEGKASCRAGAYPPQTTVGVPAVGQSYGPLVEGDRILLDGPFRATTEFTFVGASACTIHTSCSVPLVAGDQIGPFLIVSGVGTLGGECSIDIAPTPPPQPIPTVAPVARPIPTVAPVARPIPPAAPVARPIPPAAPVARPIPPAAPVARPIPPAAPVVPPSLAPGVTPSLAPFPSLPPIQSCEVCGPDAPDDAVLDLAFEYIPQGENSIFQDASPSTCMAGVYPDDNVFIGYALNEEDVYIVGPIAAGDVVIFAGPLNRTTSTELFFSDGDAELNCTIDFSCSSPLIVGDQFGPFRLIAGHSEFSEMCLFPVIELSQFPTGSPTARPTTAPPTPRPSPSPTTARPADAPTPIPTPAPTMVPSEMPNLNNFNFPPNCTNIIPCDDDDERIFVCNRLSDGRTSTTCVPVETIASKLNKTAGNVCGICPPVRIANPPTAPPTQAPTPAPTTLESICGTGAIIDCDSGNGPGTGVVFCIEIPGLALEQTCAPRSTVPDLISLGYCGVCPDTLRPSEAPTTAAPTTAPPTKFPTTSPSDSPSTLTPSAKPSTSPSDLPTIAPTTPLPSAAPSRALDGCNPVINCSGVFEGTPYNGVLFCAAALGLNTEAICVPILAVKFILDLGFCGQCPTSAPSLHPSSSPSQVPSPSPSAVPTPDFGNVGNAPTRAPSNSPSADPTDQPVTGLPSSTPSGPLDNCNPVIDCVLPDTTVGVTVCASQTSELCIPRRSVQSSLATGLAVCGKCPTQSPSAAPSNEPTPNPTNPPTPLPTPAPTPLPTPDPTPLPTPLPTPRPTTPQPSAFPTEPAASASPSGQLDNCNPINRCSNSDPDKLSFCVTDGARPVQLCISPGQVQNLLAKGQCGECPSDSPSVSPSILPSGLPSSIPSSSPSSEPTPAPTTAAPSSSPTEVFNGCTPIIPCQIQDPDDPTIQYNGTEFCVVIEMIPVLQFCVPTPFLQFFLTLNVGGCGVCPTIEPTISPSELPSPSPSTAPSNMPSVERSGVPSPSPSERPSQVASNAPSSVPTPQPSSTPSLVPSPAPSEGPSSFPSTGPSPLPSSLPSSSPSSAPVTSSPVSAAPVTPQPSSNPTGGPSPSPSLLPSASPSDGPTSKPTTSPSNTPSQQRSDVPSPSPSERPTQVASENPSALPSTQPSLQPSRTPSNNPSEAPITPAPTTSNPSSAPSMSPSLVASAPPSDMRECIIRDSCNAPNYSGGNNGFFMCLNAGNNFFYSTCVHLSEINSQLNDDPSHECGLCEGDEPSSSPSSSPSFRPLCPADPCGVGHVNICLTLVRVNTCAEITQDLQNQLDMGAAICGTCPTDPPTLPPTDPPTLAPTPDPTPEPPKCTIAPEFDQICGQNLEITRKDTLLENLNIQALGRSSATCAEVQAACAQPDVTCTRNGGLADIQSICGCAPCRELVCLPSTQTVDVCFAIDQSGSICNPSPTKPNTCSSCGRCRQQNFSRQLCCSNYEQVVNLASALVQQVSNISPNSKFGYTRFSTSARRVSALTSASNIQQKLRQTSYRGGWTNTAAALDDCSDILSSSTASKKVIIVMTDGDPTYNGQGNSLNSNGAETFTAQKATDARNAGNDIVTMAFGTNLQQSYLANQIASDPSLAFQATGFNQADVFTQALTSAVSCG